MMVVLIVGCAQEDAIVVTSAEGRLLYAHNCAVCHADNATGNGSAAVDLRTPPPDLTQIAQRRDGVWPMLEVMSIIDGYTKTTEPRQDMPVIAELAAGPRIDFDTGNGSITPVPARLIAIATYLESIQSPKPTIYVP